MICSGSTRIVTLTRARPRPGSRRAGTWSAREARQRSRAGRGAARPRSRAARPSTSSPAGTSSSSTRRGHDQVGLLGRHHEEPEHHRDGRARASLSSQCARRAVDSFRAHLRSQSRAGPHDAAAAGAARPPSENSSAEPAAQRVAVERASPSGRPPRARCARSPRRRPAPPRRSPRRGPGAARCRVPMCPAELGIAGQGQEAPGRGHPVAADEARRRRGAASTAGTGSRGDRPRPWRPAARRARRSCAAPSCAPAR